MVVLKRRGIFNNMQGTVSNLYNVTVSARALCNNQLAVVQTNLISRNASFSNKTQGDSKKRGIFNNGDGGHVDTVWNRRDVQKRGEFDNQHGGHVTTVHNEKRGIFNNEDGGHVDTVWNRRDVNQIVNVQTRNAREIAKRGNFYNTGSVKSVYNGDGSGEQAPMPPQKPSKSGVNNFYNEGDVQDVDNKKKRSPNVLIIGDNYYNNGTSVKTVYNIKRDQLAKRGEFYNHGEVTTDHNKRDAAGISKRGIFNNQDGGQVDTVYNKRDVAGLAKRGSFINSSGGKVSTVYNNGGISKPAPAPAPMPEPMPAPVPSAPRKGGNFNNKNGGRVSTAFNKRGTFNNQDGGQVDTVYN
jgi:hypothetical protein